MTARATGRDDPFPVVRRDGRPVQVVRCTGCGAEGLNSAGNGRGGTAVVHAAFQRRGWRNLLRDRGLCPACVATETARRRARRSHREETVTMSTTPPMPAAAPAKSPPPAAPSPAASRALVDLYLLLADHYDRDVRRYRAGWSDARLARETGLAPEVVAQRREADFGPLVDPPEQVAQRKALDSAALALGDIALRLKEAQTALEDLRKLASGGGA